MPLRLYRLVENFKMQALGLTDFTSKCVFVRVCVRARTHTHIHTHAQLCLFVTPWTLACQVSLSKEFSRQEYWSGLPFPFPPLRHLSNPEIKAASLASPVLAGEFFTPEPPVGSYCVFAELRWEKPLHQKNFISEMRRNENLALFLKTSRSRNIIPEELHTPAASQIRRVVL